MSPEWARKPLGVNASVFVPRTSISLENSLTCVCLCELVYVPGRVGAAYLHVRFVSGHLSFIWICVISLACGLWLY